MKYQQLGETDLTVSEVGFGVWTVATDWWGKIEPDDADGHFGLGAVYAFGHDAHRCLRVTAGDPEEQSVRLAGPKRLELFIQRLPKDRRRALLEGVARQLSRRRCGWRCRLRFRGGRLDVAVAAVAGGKHGQRQQRQAEGSAATESSGAEQCKHRSSQYNARPAARAGMGR